MHDAGSVDAFHQSWNALDPGERYHFARGEPQTQIQFAFQNHWRVFRAVMGDVNSGRALEVGCGRGSMGAFFADAGFDTHLLDTSTQALAIARRNFAADGLACKAIAGDALQLPYADGTFDVTVSIGLLEHFSDVAVPVAEQIRVLRPGGVFLGYVVPERLVSVQFLSAPVNALLRARQRAAGAPVTRQNKAPLFRNDFRAQHYLDVLDRLGVASRSAFGMFPVPLVSHSPAFPFTANDPSIERKIVRTWRFLLGLRPGNGDPWVCPELWGLAFLVWARKA